MTERTTLTKRAIELAISSTLALTIAAAAVTTAAAETSGSSSTQSSTLPDKPTWELRTDSAYLEVYAYYCAPAFHDPAGRAAEPSGIEVAIYTSRFRAEYGGDCRAFYLDEIARRVGQPTEQELIAARRR
jgi:hypothetical protein